MPDTEGMRRCALLMAIAAGVLGGASRVDAQTAVQRVTFQVNAVNRLAVTGAPSPLTIATANAGSAPTPVSEVGGTYAVTTNETNKKITATLDQALPSGVTLEVQLAAPGGAVSPGPIALTTSGADVVTGISATTASSLGITYRLSATPAAGVMPAPESRLVTFTLVAAP